MRRVGVQQHKKAELHGQGCESQQGRYLKMTFKNWSEGYSRSLPYVPVAGLLAGGGGWGRLWYLGA